MDEKELELSSVELADNLVDEFGFTQKEKDSREILIGPPTIVG